MTWRVEMTETALEQLKAIRDARIRAALLDRIERLAKDPEKQGKALTADLSGYRSVRAAGQRYRILYRIVGERVVVVVVALGIRKDSDKKDVYTLARKLIRIGLLGDETT